MARHAFGLCPRRNCDNRPRSSAPRAHPSVVSTVLAALLVLVLAVPAAALHLKETNGPATLEVRSAADRPALALADVVHVEITLTGTKALRVEALVRPVPGSAWELLETASPEPQAQGAGGVRWQQTLTLAPTTPGELKLELTPLIFHDGDGGEQKIVWKPLTISVQTQVKDLDLRQARDITTTEEPPEPPPNMPMAWLWLALAPVLVLAIGGLWLPAAGRARAGPRSASALRKALRECDRLVAMQLPEKNRAKSFAPAAHRVALSNAILNAASSCRHADKRPPNCCAVRTPVPILAPKRNGGCTRSSRRPTSSNSLARS